MCTRKPKTLDLLYCDSCLIAVVWNQTGDVCALYETCKQIYTITNHLVKRLASRIWCLYWPLLGFGLRGIRVNYRPSCRGWISRGKTVATSPDRAAATVKRVEQLCTLSLQPRILTPVYSRRPAQTGDHFYVTLMCDGLMPRVRSVLNRQLVLVGSRILPERLSLGELF